MKKQDTSGKTVSRQRKVTEEKATAIARKHAILCPEPTFEYHCDRLVYTRTEEESKVQKIKSKAKTGEIVVQIKEPDEVGELIQTLGLSEKTANKFFEFGEYATLRIVIDEDMRIVGGEVLKVKR